MKSNDFDVWVYHTGYLTDDLDRAVAFYEQIFGGKVLSRAANVKGETAFVMAGGFEVELIAPADKTRLAGRTGLVLDHVGYFVPDLDQAMAELKKKGAKFAGEPSVNPVGYRMIFLDTASSLGTRIHLTEKPKQAEG
jgi:predicted enzyme related to lactoylglutathione lyase